MRRKLVCVASYVGLVLTLLGLCTYVARNPVRDLPGRTASAWMSRRLHSTLEIGIEYSINPYLKVRGSSSDTVDSAVDILWRMDY